MTKIAINGPASGTGTYTLRAPVTNDNPELILPTGGTNIAAANATGMPVILDGTPVLESGSNSDGEWARGADGRQICWKGLQLLYVSSQVLAVEWTYPKAFISAGTGLVVMHQIESITYNSTNSLIANAGISSYQGKLNTSIIFQQRRLEGTANFLAGDACNSDGIALGRWV